MKILVISDHEEKALWDFWSRQTADRLSDISFILSAGDLDADYLEFLVTMLNVPLVYVHGNHDGAYLEKPPKGCINADGRVIDIKPEKDSETVRILGLGGSMRHRKNAPFMFSEYEMRKRIHGLRWTALKDAARGRLKGKKSIDILLTHAPCRGYGDLPDLPHRGFECFNWLLDRLQPRLHVYGHVHKGYGRSYSGQSHSGQSYTGQSQSGQSYTGQSNSVQSHSVQGMPGQEDSGFRQEESGSRQESSGFRRLMTHPSGTTLVNADGYLVLVY